MVSSKKGWEFADASECLSFHYRNSSLYNTGLFNYINNLYAELWFGALSRTSYQRLRATLPRSLVRKLKYPNRGISNVSLLNSSVKFYTLRIFPGKMGQDTSVKMPKFPYWALVMQPEFFGEMYVIEPLIRKILYYKYYYSSISNIRVGH